MSFSAEVIAQLKDSLVAAATGLTPTLGVDSNAVFTQSAPTGNRQVPFVLVRLPTDFEKITWSATGNTKDSHMTVAVSLFANVSPDGSHPFGDSSTVGILNLYDQLMNAIDNARGALQTATSPNKLVDYKTESSISWKEDPAVATINVMIDFWFRYTAGGR